jgi:LPXTG-motif cell wall-anchored protein
MPKGYELTYTAKNGTITVLTNTYNEGVVVKTGDDTRIVAVTAVFLGSLLAFIILLLYRRRQQV